MRCQKVFARSAPQGPNLHDRADKEDEQKPFFVFLACFFVQELLEVFALDLTSATGLRAAAPCSCSELVADFLYEKKTLAGQTRRIAACFDISTTFAYF